MSLPGTYPLDILSGDDLHLVFAMTDDAGDPVDFTGCTTLAQARASANSADVVATMTTGVNGDGNLTLDVTDAQALTWVGLRGVWDFQVTWPSGDVLTYLSGTWRVRYDVSRSV